MFKHAKENRPKESYFPPEYEQSKKEEGLISEDWGR